MSETGIVNIHGKQYHTVAKRVGDFRHDYADYSLTTEIIQAGDPVIMKATISNKDGRIIATGHAEELRGASQINRTSALENCETSAIGRALAAFGIAGTEFASADEVANAIHQQSNSKPEYSGDVLAGFQAAKDKKELQAIWVNLSPQQQAKYRKDLDLRLEKLS